MTTRRFQLNGDSVEALRERIRREHGSRARIISLEKVTIGGIAGYLARHTYEATVEVDEPATFGQHGIAALIADAEEAEQLVGYDVATSGESFESIMQNLQSQITAEPRQPDPSESRVAGPPRQLPAARAQHALTAVPHDGRRADADFRSDSVFRLDPDLFPLSSAGDLVVFIGLGATALDAARATPGLLAVAGHQLPRGIRHINDRRAAYLARADAVADDTPVTLAWQLSSALAPEHELQKLAEFQPDQIWIIVDARHKADDTARWVAMVSRATSIDAMLVIAEDQTASPTSMAQLGIPRGQLPSARAGDGSTADDAPAETIG